MSFAELELDMVGVAGEGEGEGDRCGRRVCDAIVSNGQVKEEMREVVRGC